LGGVLGGGKGAVIGAGAGGGGGAAISKGEQIRIESETALVFRLEKPLDVTISTRPLTSSTSTKGGPAKLEPPASNNTSASNVVGTWTVTTDNTRTPLQLVLHQNGNSLDGTISNPTGGGDLPVRGSVNGSYVTFSTRSQSGAGSAQMQFSGAIQGDTMQGTVTTTNTNSTVYGGGYPGGGYPGGRSGRRGGGYPGGGRGASTQANWSAQRID
jgi:hypothetical protein